jgi:hypothetical protein
MARAAVAFLPHFSARLVINETIAPAVWFCSSGVPPTTIGVDGPISDPGPMRILLLAIAM